MFAILLARPRRCRLLIQHRARSSRDEREIYHRRAMLKSRRDNRAENNPPVDFTRFRGNAPLEIDFGVSLRVVFRTTNYDHWRQTLFLRKGGKTNRVLALTRKYALLGNSAIYARVRLADSAGKAGEINLHSESEATFDAIPLSREWLSG